MAETRSLKRDGGSATLEFALALPALVVVLALAMGCVRWALDAAQAQSAAAHGARIAIVDSDVEAIAAAERVLGSPGVTLSRADGWVTVCAPVPARLPLPAGFRCATARDEP